MLGSIIAMVMFIMLGTVFSAGKGAYLIAGFNTMGDKKQEEYDRDALGKFMGKTMFGMAFTMLLTILSEVYEIVWLYKASFVMIVGIAIFILIYANTGNRFKK